MNKYKSDVFASIHDAALALRKVGAIDKLTMREFDESCLIKTPHFKPSEIKTIREKHNLSQSVFARYLNISESTLQKWEAGTKKPSNMALKLLDIVNKHGLSILA